MNSCMNFLYLPCSWFIKLLEWEHEPQIDGFHHIWWILIHHSSNTSYPFSFTFSSWIQLNILQFLMIYSMPVALLLCFPGMGWGVFFSPCFILNIFDPFSNSLSPSSDATTSTLCSLSLVLIVFTSRIFTQFLFKHTGPLFMFSSSMP